MSAEVICHWMPSTIRYNFLDPQRREHSLSVSPCSNPMVTGTSVLGVKFTGGVIIAADMLGSYGSLARFRNISRLMKVTAAANIPARAAQQTNLWLTVCGLCLSAGEQQHHPGSFRRLCRLPVPEAGHRTDGVSCCSLTDGAGAAQ